ncbi:MAG: sugar phosphate isomerase/epimerase [Fibrobacterales bacterium]
MKHNTFRTIACIATLSTLFLNCTQQFNTEDPQSSDTTSNSSPVEIDSSLDIFSSEYQESSDNRTMEISSSTTLERSSNARFISSTTDLSSSHYSNPTTLSSEQAESSNSVSSSETLPESSSSEILSSENQWGVQMYTFRDDLDTKFKETLQFIKSAGYDQIELAGYYGYSADTLFAWGQEIGVDFMSTHHLTEPLRDSLPQLIERALTLKAQYLVLAWLAPDERETIAQYKSLAQKLNEWGATLKQYDLTMVYHNHEFEFEPINGKIPYEVLLNNTDSSLVSFQIDIAWAYKSGIDPLKYYRMNPERFPLFHLKDLDAPGAEIVLDLGEGNVDYETILPELLSHPNQLYFIEHDHTLNPHATIETNMNFLKSLGL